ncbi:hypothetical protein NDU88_002201 [Pleurodeles waltl]|uniref:Uncharacterized protein n=1 Tax=Pleurodeles waltl TaxID=8319 RepID=A0AAV7MQY2_PLEWA|nr:hypothetical protein NDU88_002201 [Pleurodeles waltl]
MAEATWIKPTFVPLDFEWNFVTFSQLATRMEMCDVSEHAITARDRVIRRRRTRTRERRLGLGDRWLRRHGLNLHLCP